MTQAAAGVPPVADAILAKTFARDPAARFASPMELREALAAALAGGTPNLGPSVAPNLAPTAEAPRQAAVREAQVRATRATVAADRSDRRRSPRGRSAGAML